MREYVSGRLSGCLVLCAPAKPCQVPRQSCETPLGALCQDFGFFLAFFTIFCSFRPRSRAALSGDPFRRGWLSWQPAHRLSSCLSWAPALAKMQSLQLRSGKIQVCGGQEVLRDTNGDCFLNKALLKRTSTEEPGIWCFLPFEKGTSASLT